LTAVAGLAAVAGAFTVTKAITWTTRRTSGSPAHRPRSLHAAQAMLNWDQVSSRWHALNVPHLFCTCSPFR